MILRTLCPRCGSTAGIVRGTVARHITSRYVCPGTGAPVGDWPDRWLAEETARVQARVDLAPGRIARAEAAHAAELARIEADRAAADADLRALARLAAKRGTP
ncbi:MAG: hypothetical protein Q8S73_37060 [Deltaproteobacteria bacterium]|nr:hypothetical protein [Myxococcales bacterium]MDP3219771.1 hypothetical protein [Deltaproteobacteria bacterium]